MFDELEKYKQCGNFFFKCTESLAEVCNAPRNKYGVFMVYALAGGHIELVYIGKSGNGSKEKDLRIDPKEGLKEILVNGIGSDETERKNSWPVQMMIDNIDALHVHWYVTIDVKHKDSPSFITNTLLQKYRSIYGHLPRWNHS